ncbi:methyltransferase family protein [Methylocaldum sp.]|uniref:methyltransferase family protein n=1 Tax=Methylocaldum sp. TaxID=1969727 RepID=UPI002D4A64D3|nr:NnrU family protein [Methylocaldum sp.]HYE37251.1 NnrU family protein [Methylocaldum sp.]
MWHNVARTAVATLAFCAVHSLLASRRAKQTAANLIGERQRKVWYRPIYVATSFASAAMLARYIRQLPDRTLYTLESPSAQLVQLLRFGIVAYGATAVGQIGPGNMLGLPGLKAWWAGAHDVPPEPEAQGPRLGSDGRMKAGGPFRWIRHPLNALAVPVLWLTPRLTVNGLVFNVVATAYAYLGSRHEEARLLQAYGEAYEAYRSGGTPFFFPSPLPLLRLGGQPQEKSATRFPKASA